MYFLLIIIATVSVSFQFVFNDKFREETDNTLNSSLKFNLYSSVVGFVVLLILNGVQFNVTVFSLLTACVYSLTYIAFCYATFKALDVANLSVYSVFSMIGGMILPFVYGILCGEEFKIIRMLCCILVGISIIMSMKSDEHTGKSTVYYMLVFVLNGLFGVISKFHQFHADACVDSGSFMLLIKITSVLFSFILLSINKKHKVSINSKAAISCCAYGVLNSVGNLLFLVALLHVPASVQYPVITGGVIIISTLITILKGENIRKKDVGAACIAFSATLLMAV